MSERYIPVGIKRQVRENCGYGCIVCGEIFCQFEHINLFADVKEHVVDNIVLLCLDHHGRVTNNLMSKEKVREHQLNPYCLQPGKKPWSKIFPPTGFKVNFCGTEISGFPILSMYNYETLIWFDKSENYKEPALNFKYYQDNDLIFEIDQNNLQLLSDDYSIFIEGNRFNLAKAEKVLFEFASNDHLFNIEKIDFTKGGYVIKYPVTHPDMPETRFVTLGKNSFNGIDIVSKKMSYFGFGNIVDNHVDLIENNVASYYEKLILNDQDKNVAQAMYNKGCGYFCEMPLFPINANDKKRIVAIINNLLGSKYDLIAGLNKEETCILFLYRTKYV